MSGISPARNFRSGMEERASFRNRTVPLADQTEARLRRVVCHSRWVIKPRNSLRNVRIAERFEFAYGMCRLAAVMMQPPDPGPTSIPVPSTKNKNRKRPNSIPNSICTVAFGRNDFWGWEFRCWWWWWWG
jgi:hypothetical protein